MGHFVRRSVLVLLVALSLGVFSAGPQTVDAASYKWVYIVMPKWLGNCPDGRVSGIQASVGSTWSTNWDYGDDIVYGKVMLDRSQQLTYNLFCKAGKAGYYQAWTLTIKPPSNTVTIFVGPSGVQYQSW